MRQVYVAEKETKKEKKRKELMKQNEKEINQQNKISINKTK